MIVIFKVIFLFFWYISFVLLFFKSKKFKRIYTATFIFSLISLAALFTSYYIGSKAYVQVSEAVLKTGPGDLYHDIGNVKDGDKVALLAKKNGWYLVVTANKNRGWLKEQDVMKYVKGFKNF